MEDTTLHSWGWTEDLTAIASSHILDGTTVGRVVRQTHHIYRVVHADDDDRIHFIDSRVSGAFEFRAIQPSDFPVLGDWVVLTPEEGIIHAVLPRKTSLSRAAAGNVTVEQLFVANIDVIFLVFGLDGGRNFTVGLLERSLVAARQSGARPVVVLNKVDCATRETMDTVTGALAAAAPGVACHIVSALRGDGIAGLREEATEGRTIGLLGKSGVGKSALVNALAGTERARTGGLRRGDLSGRHTTTHKELHIIDGGAIVADLPGLRELQVWADDEALDDAFPEIESLAGGCRFRDCTHDGEPGCRVREALETGELSPDRYEAYREYRRELAYLHRRRDQKARQDEQRKWKAIAKEQRRFKKG